MLEYKTARELFEISFSNSTLEIDQLEYVELEGWVRTNRNNGQIGFIELNDGSYFRNVQIVYHTELENIQEIEKILTGTSIKVTGKYVATPKNKQPFEIEATEISIIGKCDDRYPMQKKKTRIRIFTRNSSFASANQYFHGGIPFAFGISHGNS